MSLKDRVEADNKNIFMNLEQFASPHKWGRKIISCVVDNEGMEKNMKSRYNDYQDDSERQMVYVCVSELEKAPRVRQEIMFDNRLMVIVQLGEDMGIYSILMEERQTRVI